MRQPRWSKDPGNYSGRLEIHDGNYVEWVVGEYTVLRWSTAFELGPVVTSLVAHWGEPDDNSKAILRSCESCAMSSREAIGIVKADERDVDFLRINYSQLDAGFVWGERDTEDISGNELTELAAIYRPPIPVFVAPLLKETAHPDIGRLWPAILHEVAAPAMEYLDPN